MTIMHILRSLYRNIWSYRMLHVLYLVNCPLHTIDLLG